MGMPTNLNGVRLRDDDEKVEYRKECGTELEGALCLNCGADELDITEKELEEDLE